MFSLLLTAAMAATAMAGPGRGVSETLARERAAAIRDLRYDLHFAIPADRRDPVQGHALIRFSLDEPRQVVLDFAQPADRLKSVRVGGLVVDAPLVDGHIVIPSAVLPAGAVEIAVEFVSGDEALNRSDEFLYSLHVPARAQLTFPCFDQPDLKARYTLTLDVPPGWVAVANGREVERSGGRYRFAETEPLSTYLFAFAAGRFAVDTAVRAGRTFRMFHRETDAAKAARNREAIFDLHASALAWLEQYTAFPYPWGKFDFVLIPSFQFGGMEHPGSIFYNQSGLMLEESATQNQLLERASLIAHETAHMWFGDLVTMRWFDDVWMKEVFANFMAAKIVNPSFPEVNHDLRFFLAHHPAAYQVDRTAGTNAIRQPLSNLSDAGQLYGPIIYQKAPVVMRQLELIAGERAFRDGLRQYLRRFAFANATWNDLVEILDGRTTEDLAAWSRAWVEERGRPRVTADLQVNARGRIARLTLRVDDPLERGLVWPQRLRVALGYAGQVRELPVAIDGPQVRVRAAEGLGEPHYVLAGGGGLGYGLFVLDDRSRQYLLGHIEDVPDPLTRGSAWVALWENLLEGRVAPAALLDAAMRAVPREADEQNAQRILAYLVRAFWRWQSPEERAARGPELEGLLRRELARAGSPSRKAAWFNAYRDTVLSKEGLAWLERVWRRDESIQGLPLSEVDEIAMALELAVREVPEWDAILRLQLDRIQNPDRRARFLFVMPALSADSAAREAAFARLREVEHRRREPWVIETLQYLNHPLREAHARRFIRPALEMLRDVQRTGDIFFPTRWMDSTLWGHSSPEAARTVEAFLAEELQYPQRLRWTILSASDELFRRVRTAE